MITNECYFCHNVISNVDAAFLVDELGWSWIQIGDDFFLICPHCDWEKNSGHKNKKG